jgi:hypothetical protein
MPKAKLIYGRSKAYTEKIDAMLEFIRRFIRENGYPPELNDFIPKFGASKSVINYQLDRMVDAGLIERDAYICRGMRIVADIGRMERLEKLAIAAMELSASVVVLLRDGYTSSNWYESKEDLIAQNEAFIKSVIQEVSDE